MPPFAARESLTVTNGFLPLLPLKKNVPLPPTCGPGIPAPCGLYQPSGFDPNMFTPTVQIWDLTVERQLAKDLMLSVGYVGSQSYHTNLTMNTNASAPEVCQDPLYLRQDRPYNLLRWDLEVDPGRNGEKARAVGYEFKLELDRQLNIGSFQSESAR